MSAILVKPNMFQGGDTANLCAVIRGLAIDNARRVLLDYPPEKIDPPLVQPSLTISDAQVPPGPQVPASGEFAPMGWFMVSVAQMSENCAMLVKQINPTLDNLGLGEIKILDEGVPRSEFYIHDMGQTVTGELSAERKTSIKALQQLQNNVSAVIGGVNRVLLATGQDQIADWSGGKKFIGHIRVKTEVENLQGESDRKPIMVFEVNTSLNMAQTNLATTVQAWNNQVVPRSSVRWPDPTGEAIDLETFIPAMVLPNETDDESDAVGGQNLNHQMRRVEGNVEGLAFLVNDLLKVYNMDLMIGCVGMKGEINYQTPGEDEAGPAAAVVDREWFTTSLSNVIVNLTKIATNLNKVALLCGEAPMTISTGIHMESGGDFNVLAIMQEHPPSNEEQPQRMVSQKMLNSFCRDANDATETLYRLAVRCRSQEDETISRGLHVLAG